MDEIKKAGKLGYSKGYAAGKKRLESDTAARERTQRQSERFDRFLCAAITGLLAGNAPWQKNGVPDKTGKDYADTAVSIARELMRKVP